MITKKNLKRKRNPADRASYFTVITQFICTQQQKSLILNLFPFEFFLNSLKKTSINFPVRNFWKSLLQYITIYLSTRKRKNNNPQLLYFSCLLLLYCRSIIHYYTILSFCNKNYSMFYRIRKKKIENYRFHQNRKSKKCYCITTTTTTSTTTYYYYIENVPLCKKQRSLCVLSWCLNTTTITRDSILFMMGTLNNTKLVFFQKENITKKVILIISRVDEWRKRRVWTTRKCWINSEERLFLLMGVATKWVGPQAIHWRKKKDYN